MGELFRRLHYLLNRRKLDEELQSDMAFHREMAAREGRNNFGNTLRLREQARESWGWTWIDRLIQDLSYGARMLTRTPVFTSIVVLVLAVGVGVNVAAFSLFNLVALKPLPVRDPESLVRLERRSPENTASEMPYLSTVFYREHAKSLSAVMAVMGVPPLELENDEQPVSASFATENYFAELGTRAAFGKLFDPVRVGSAQAAPVVILSYEFWQRRFGADPSIVGKTIHLNKKQVIVAGITPFDFASLGGQHPELWLPFSQVPYFLEGSKVLTDSTAGGVRMWGRLAPGVVAKVAEQELLSLTNELRREHPREIWDKEYIHIEPGGHLQVMQPDMYRVAAMVSVLMLLILAVACANVGGLLLARGVTREHEIGIRVAIGASRTRIFRQLFTESVLLATVGSVAGAALGFVVVRETLRRLDAPKWLSAVPDWRVTLFAFGVALVAALLFGLAPALQIARQRQRKTIARQFLVGAQVAASCVLLIVAGLLVRAVLHTLYTDPGFGCEQIITVDPGLGRHGYKPDAARVYLDEMQSRLRAMPNVKSVALVRILPLGHTVSRIGTEIAGHPVDIYPNWTEPDFFKSMGIPLLRGRNLLPGEKNAVIVSESFARKSWPVEDPIGKPFLTGEEPRKQRDTIVGVVGNARVNSLNDGDAVEIYWAAQPADMPDMAVVVKTVGAIEGLPPTVRSIAESLDPKVFPEIRSLKDLYKNSVSEVEMIATIVTLIGLIAIFIAAVGIIGLVSYSVSERIKEIAIRIALGAGRWHVLFAILRQFVWPVAFGLLVGIVVTAAFSGLLRQGLYGVNNLDPASYAGAIVLLLFVATAAALIPAKRALGVDPMRALHHD
jgi:predicted permease